MRLGGFFCQLLLKLVFEYKYHVIIHAVPYPWKSDWEIGTSLLFRASNA